MHRTPTARLLTVLSYLLVSASATRAAGQPIPVAVSVPPLAWPLAELAGDAVEVTVLLPPGASPHAWEPTPRQRLALADARLLVVVGHPSLPFESRWIGDVGTEAEVPSVAICRVVRCDTDGESPHPWLEPGAMRRLSQALAATLAKIQPNRARELDERLAALERRVDDLDRTLRETLAPFTGRRFFVDHPAWEAFARTYDLEQVAIEANGKEAGPRRLAQLVEQARADGVRTVFNERGTNPRAARTLAAEIGAEVVTLDPLAADWYDNLERTAGMLAEALR